MIKNYIASNPAVAGVFALALALGCTPATVGGGAPDDRSPAGTLEPSGRGGRAPSGRGGAMGGTQSPDGSTGTGGAGIGGVGTGGAGTGGAGAGDAGTGGAGTGGVGGRAPLDAGSANQPGPDMAPPAGGSLAVAFDPPSNIFMGTVEVKIVTGDPQAKIHFTIDDTVPTAQSPVYSAPLRLAASTMIRAFAVSAAGAGPIVNRSYVAVAPEASSWSSNLPVVLLHSHRSRPTAKGVVKQGSITVLQPEEGGRVSLGATRPTLHSRMGVNVRGSSSSDWPKKSYKVEFWGGGTDQDVQMPLLGMPREADWVLFGPFQYDRTFVRNSVMYAVSNQLGRWAPQTRFVELFFGDTGRPIAPADYMGVYVVMEKIEADKYRLPIAQIQPTDITPPNVTGGYIFKVDRLDPGEVGLKAGLGPGNIWGARCATGLRGACGIGDPSSIGVLAFHEPAEVEILKVPAQAAYLRETIDTFANTLAAKGDYGALIEVPAWIDYHIIKAFVKDMDAHRLSAFFYKDRGGKIVAGPTWDFDRTLGCTTDPRCPVVTMWDAAGGEQGDDSVNSFNYGWWRGLFADPAFKTAYFTRFRELLGKQLSEAHLFGLIDMYVAQLGTEAPARNFQKWTADAPAGGHAAEVARLKSWIQRRIVWIKKCLDLPDPIACRG